MRKRDELSDPASCLNRAKDDEWTFVLLGRDVAAPVAVRAWIDERIRLGKNRPDDPQILEAEEWIKTVLAEKGALNFAIRYRQLLELNRQLVQLDSDPHPGLATWSTMRQKVCQEIRSILISEGLVKEKVGPLCVPDL